MSDRVEFIEKKMGSVVNGREMTQLFMKVGNKVRYIADCYDELDILRIKKMVENNEPKEKIK